MQLGRQSQSTSAVITTNNVIIVFSSYLKKLVTFETQANREGEQLQDSKLI